MGRVFFLGAGMSKSDGFPLSSELIGAVPYYARQRTKSKPGSDRLRRFLKTTYGIDRQQIADGAQWWEASFKNNINPKQPSGIHEWPSITSVLTVLDLAIDGNEPLGVFSDGNPKNEKSFSAMSSDA